MSDGFERSTEFLPLAFSREQIAGQVQTIGSIEGRARPRSSSRISREESRPGHSASDRTGPERTGCYEAAAHAAICARCPASRITRSRRVPRKFRQTRVPPARLARRASVASTPNAAVETVGCRRSLGIPSKKPDGGLPWLEAPLVDLQRLDLRLECRGRHPEAAATSPWCLPTRLA